MPPPIELGEAAVPIDDFGRLIAKQHRKAVRLGELVSQHAFQAVFRLDAVGRVHRKRERVSSQPQALTARACRHPVGTFPDVVDRFRNRG